MHEKLKYAHNPNEDFQSFYFDHVHILSREQLTLHRQPTWELSYVITGQGIRIIGDTMERFSQGEVVLVPPDIPHHWAFDEQVFDNEGRIENITLTFTAGFLKNTKNIFPGLADYITAIQQYTNALSFNGHALEKLQTIMQKTLTQSQAEQVISLLEIFVVIASQETANEIGGFPIIEDKAAKRLQKVHLYVMNHYNNIITLDEVAAHAKMERSAFCVFFKKKTGKSFFTFLAEYRIDLACDMLQKTDKSVAEICFESGFGDVPYFNRTFKKLKGMTPKEYRNLQ